MPCLDFTMILVVLKTFVPTCVDPLLSDNSNFSFSIKNSQKYKKPSQLGFYPSF